jgi:hypothetical protein
MRPYIPLNQVNEIDTIEIKPYTSIFIIENIDKTNITKDNRSDLIAVFLKEHSTDQIYFFTNDNTMFMQDYNKKSINFFINYDKISIYDKLARVLEHNENLCTVTTIILNYIFDKETRLLSQLVLLTKLYKLNLIVRVNASFKMKNSNSMLKLIDYVYINPVCKLQDRRNIYSYFNIKDIISFKAFNNILVALNNKNKYLLYDNISGSILIYNIENDINLTRYLPIHLKIPIIRYVSIYIKKLINYFKSLYRGKMKYTI